MNQHWTELKQRFMVPILTLSFFLLLLFVFRAVLLPFILALVIVFLMEPLVRRLQGMHIRSKRLPRWGAVLVVYASFFASLSLFFLIFIPPLTVEVGKAADEVPAYFTKVRETYLPQWSAQLEALLGLDLEPEVGDLERTEEAIAKARVGVAEAVTLASAVDHLDEIPVVDHSGAVPLLYVGGDRDPDAEEARKLSLGPIELLSGGGHEIDRDKVAFTIVPDYENEGFAFVMGDNNLRVYPLDDGSFSVQLEPEGGDKSNQHFNLERELMKGFSGILESGTEYAGDLLLLIQTLVAFVINAFVMLLMMLMVAAFMSIDLPRIMAFFRSLVPVDWLSGYDELLGRLNKGLSGVIRGQLVICLINGTLTGLGLWVLGVDFALMLGIIAGVLSLIPIFGTIISTIPAVLMGLTQGVSTALLVLAWILFVHALDANFFTPKIVGSSSEMHPVIIIFALLAGESTFGLVGALLAVPVASIIQTIFIFLLSHSKSRKLALEMAAAETTLPDLPDEAPPSEQA